MKEIYRAFLKEHFTLWFLCLYVLIEYLKPQLMYPALNVAPVGTISILLLLVAVLLSGFRPPKVGGLEILFLVFSVWVVISAVLGWNPSFSWRFRNVFLGWMILYYCMLSILTTPRRILLFSLFFLLINFKMSQHGARSFALRGFSFAGWGIAGAPGWFSNSGELALEMTITFVAAVCLFTAHRQFLSKTRWYVLLALLPGTAFLSVLASSSRGGQLALLSVCLLLLVTSKYRWRGAMVFVAVLSVGWLILPQAQKDRFSSMGEDRTSQNRLEYWGDAIEIVQRYPLTGLGYENWVGYYRAHYDPQGEEIHNTTLEAFTELGIPGGLLFLLMVSVAVGMNIRTYRRWQPDDPVGRSMAGITLGLLIGLVGTIVAAQFMSVLFYPMFWLAFAMTTVLWNLASTQAKSGSPQPRRRSFNRRQEALAAQAPPPPAPAPALSTEMARRRS